MSARTSMRGGLWLWLGTACLGCGGTIELGGRVPEQWFDGNAVDPVGTAAATTLYQGSLFSAQLYAVDETTLYVALDDGESSFGRNMVWKACALSSCASTVRTLYRRANVQISTQLSGLAVAGTEMFFTATDDPARGMILACPVAGCDEQPRTLTTDVRAVRSLVADQEYVYWVDDSGSSVSRCAYAGCAAPEMRNADVLNGNTSVEMTDLALSDQYVYWGSFLRLHRMRRDFSADPEVFYESQLPLQGIAVGGGQVYFSVATLSGEVRRCPLTGCPSEPEIVATSQRWPAWLRGDDRAVYWLTTSQHSVLFRRGDLVEFSIQGSTSSRTLASDILGQGQFWPLIINSHHLYWADATGADVNRGDVTRIRTIAR